jgi:hypothetical protein
MSFGKVFATALLTAGAVAAAVVAVRSMPDIQRYLRIRRM